MLFTKAKPTKGDLMRKLTKTFIVSLTLCIAFTIWGIIPESIIGKGSLGNVTTAIQTALVSKFGWFYIISVSIILGVSIFLIVSKYGSIRLGKDDDEPDYSYMTWFAMLFSAGMGIGLVFWGVAEPLNHLYAPPFGDSATEESARLALRFSFFHWGLHPWGLYAFVALCIAYFTFRKGKASTISATVGPLFKGGDHGRIAHLFDVLAVFATVFGVATSLGLGAKQIAGGVSYLTSIPNSLTTQLVIIAIVTVLFMLSAQTGLDKGIKYLSNTNIIFAFALMIIVLFAGPTNFIMNKFWAYKK